MAFKFVTPLDEMERVSRSEIGERLDEILDKIDKEDIGYVISDEGKDDLVLVPARWFLFPLDDDFGCIINAAVRYAIGRHTYMPGLVCNYVRRYMHILDSKTIDVLVTDINRELQIGIEQEELWIKLRNELADRYEEMTKADGSNEK